MSNAREQKRIIDALDKWGHSLQNQLDELKGSILSGLDEHDKDSRSKLVEIGKVVSGEKPTAFPWHDLPRPRRLQVEAVYQFMREHKDDSDTIRNVNNACRQTFCYVKSGYHTWRQLKAYCYRQNVRDYLESRA